MATLKANRGKAAKPDITNPTYLEQMKHLDDVLVALPGDVWRDLLRLPDHKINHTDLAAFIRRVLGTELEDSVIVLPGKNEEADHVLYRYDADESNQWITEPSTAWLSTRVDSVRNMLELFVLKPLATLVRILENKLDNCKTKAKKDAVEAMLCSVEEAASKMKMIFKKLGDAVFKSHVVKIILAKQCQEGKAKKHTKDMFDQHSGYIGFDDGVYSFRENRLVTDPSVRELYITKRIPMPCRDVMAVPDDEYAECLRFLQQILPDKGVRKYFFKVCNKGLQGLNQKLCLILYNEKGDNGKSMLLELMKEAIGDSYTVTCASNMLMKATSNTPGGANEELAAIEGKRLGVISEPKGGLESGMLKQIIGGDRISKRALYKQKKVFVANMLFIILCNEPPKPDTNEPAIFTKLRLIPMEAQFVTDPALVKEEAHCYLADDDIKRNFRRWRPAIMKYMLALTDEEVPEPEKVASHSRRYKDACNMMSKFVTESIKPGKPDDVLLLSDVFWEWKQWAKDENIAIGTKSDFEKSILPLMAAFQWYTSTTVKKRTVNKCWKGCNLASTMFEEEEDAVTTM